MLRSCLIAIAGWIVLVLLYGGWLWTELPPPMHLVGPLILGTFVWFGLLTIYGARHEFADWRAQSRMSRGEPPRNGDLVSAIGTIYAGFESLQSPVSGRDCVLYSYTAGVAGGGARACAGFGMTRCSVQTAHGQFQLGTYPVLEGFPEETIESAIAEPYLSSAQFEDVALTALMKQMLAIHSQAPPLKKDLRTSIETPKFDDIRVEERIVAPGTMVTAIGRFVAATNSIVGGAREGGYLRLYPGGDARHVAAFPWKAVRSVIVGLLMVAGANGGIWWLLQRIAR